MHAITLLALFCAVAQAAYYLPGISPNNFDAGDAVSIYLYIHESACHSVWDDACVITIYMPIL